MILHVQNVIKRLLWSHLKGKLKHSGGNVLSYIRSILCCILLCLWLLKVLVCPEGDYDVWIAVIGKPHMDTHTGDKVRAMTDMIISCSECVYTVRILVTGIEHKETHTGGGSANVLYLLFFLSVTIWVGLTQYRLKCSIYYIKHFILYPTLSKALHRSILWLCCTNYGGIQKTPVFKLRGKYSSLYDKGIIFNLFTHKAFHRVLA